MSVGTEHTTKQERHAAGAMIAAAILCLVGVGGVLWWRSGGAVFNDLVMAGLAWCF